MSVAALSAPLPAFAATLTVNNGQTVGAQTLIGTETLTVNSGGTVSAATAVTWSVTGPNPSPSPGVTIDNSGTIIGSTRAIDATGSGVPRNLTLWNRAGGTITGTTNDACRLNASIGSGTVTINNFGTISSAGGQALDFDGNNSTTGTMIINNFATGIIRSTAEDAMRPGENATITNYGLIFSSSATAGAKFDGIDFQGHAGTVLNMTGGTISGFRHGITSDVNVQVTNQTGGVILGRNGSGVGSDGAGTVVNYGRITGAYDGSGTGDGDGVDIDLSGTITNYGIIEGTGAAGFKDGLANASEGISIGGGTIINYGTISGASAGIVVNNDANLSRSGSAATTLTNYGTIVGINGYAIRMENKLGDSRDNDTIVNYGTITGNGVIPDTTVPVLTDIGTLDPANGTLNGQTYGPGSARFIRGDGSAIQMGEGADRLTNYGTIIGNNGRAINMEGGNDTVTIQAGSKIVGLVDGGAGTDTLNYNKVGLSDAKKAALAAGQIVNIGGTLYTGFELFTGTSQSFSYYATGATSGIAAILDGGSTTQSSSLAAQTLIDQIATASDVNAAMAQLTPTAFQGLTTAGFTNAFQTTQIVDQRLSNVRADGVAFDVSGFGTAMALLNNDRSRSLTPAAYDPSDMTTFAYASTPTQNPIFAAADANVYKAPRMVQGDSPWGMFLYGNAIFARQGATANSPQSKFTATGITAGIDRRVTPDLVVGLLGGYTRTDADLDTLGSTSRINTWLLGAYGTYYRQNWFVNGAFVYGHNSYDNNRIALGTSNTSNANGNQFAAQGSIGADFNYGRWIVTPELGAQYTTVRVGGFSETGPVALIVAADQADSFRSSLGSRFRYRWLSPWGAMTPELRASWQHEFLDKQRDVRASFVDQALPGTFSSTAAGSGRDFGIVGAGLTANIADRTQLSLGYDFKFGGYSFTAHQLSGRLRHVF